MSSLLNFNCSSLQIFPVVRSTGSGPLANSSKLVGMSPEARLHGCFSASENTLVCRKATDIWPAETVSARSSGAAQPNTSAISTQT